MEPWFWPVVIGAGIGGLVLFVAVAALRGHEWAGAVLAAWAGESYRCGRCGAEVTYQTRRCWSCGIGLRNPPAGLRGPTRNVPWVGDDEDLTTEKESSP